MARKKKHWTQTEAGRAKMRALAKAKHQSLKDARTNDSGSKKEKATPQAPSWLAAYGAGYCQAYLDTLAHSHSVAPSVLARQVGQLLSAG